jgi:dynein assembly factor 5
VGQQLPIPQLAALQPDLLKRLDDSSNRVRVAACASLQPWVLAVAADLPEGNAAALARSLLLHMDDPDNDVPEAVCAVLEQLAAARPPTIRPLVEAAAVQHSRHLLWNRVVAACGAPV